MGQGPSAYRSSHGHYSGLQRSGDLCFQWPFLFSILLLGKWEDKKQLWVVFHKTGVPVPANGELGFPLFSAEAFRSCDLFPSLTYS